MLDLVDLLDAGDVVDLVLHVGSAIADLGSAGSAPAAASAVAPALDPSPVRLEARALDRQAPDAGRLAALSGLLAKREHDARRALLILIEDPSEPVRIAAIEAAGKKRIPEAFAPLARRYEFSEEEGAALALALARIGSTAAEPSLLALLARGAGATQLAAVKALRNVGTLASVEALHVHANGWFAGELGTDAAAAITAIQRRHARSAVRGALSIGGVRGGELSPTVPGALSEPRR